MWIHYIGSETRELAKALIREVYAAGGIPFAHYEDPEIQREILLQADREQLEAMAEWDAAEMSRMDCYIGVRGSDNVSELSDVPRGADESL